jgi:hypothetical protein
MKKTPRSEGKGAFTLLAKLQRERDEVDAAIRVIQRYTKSPGDQMHAKAAQAAALVEANGVPAPPPMRQKLGKRQVRVLEALTAEPITSVTLARQLKILGPKENPGVRVSGVLSSLRRRGLATRTDTGWVRA